jgi:3-methyl-2-oxobutanoate hydroxymethyltransferase
MPRRMTGPAFTALKGERRLVCLTAYDVLTAAALDEAGVDLLLVGDSMANVVLGHETTLPVSLDEMVSHAAAVVRARPRALVVGDMPYLTFHVTPEETLKNAARFVREAGTDGVKLEGGTPRIPHIRKLIESEIPVMGHLGLTPQSILALGGYRVQGRTRPAAERLVEEAKALEGAGCFALVLESVPAPVAEQVTRALSIPTIGIGAGAGTDGQVLVISDLLGLAPTVPRFVRRYADLHGTVVDAVRRYAEDVREGRFPGPDETYTE